MTHIQPKNLAAFGQTTFSPIGRGGLGTRLVCHKVYCSSDHVNCVYKLDTLILISGKGPLYMVYGIEQGYHYVSNEGCNTLLSLNVPPYLNYVPH